MFSKWWSQEPERSQQNRQRQNFFGEIHFQSLELQQPNARTRVCLLVSWRHYLITRGLTGQHVLERKPDDVWWKFSQIIVSGIVEIPCWSCGTSTVIPILHVTIPEGQINDANWNVLVNQTKTEINRHTRHLCSCAVTAVIKFSGRKRLILE